MSIISKKNRNKFIAGLIAIIFLTLAYFVKYYFLTSPSAEHSDKDTIQTTNQAPILNNNLSDSAEQNITLNQLTQNNKNTGDVNNEFISGDKIIDQKTIYVNPKPADRKITSEDIDRVKNQIPKNYIVELLFSFSDKECYNYGSDLSNRLSAMGYNVESSVYGQLSSFSYNPRFDISTDTNSQRANITVYPLKK